VKKHFIIFCITITLSFCLFGSNNKKSYPINQLKNYFDALNMEGGIIPANRLNSNQVWASLCLILDRPFETGIDLIELSEKNKYALKESSLLDYNEPKVNLTYVIFLNYYISNAHKIADKDLDKKVKIVIQIHRQASAKKHFKLLEGLLSTCFPSLKGIKQPNTTNKKEIICFYDYPELNTRVEYCFGYLPLDNYDEADIVLSISMAAGLNPNFESGTILIPETFIPMSLKNMIVRADKVYSVTNHLSLALNEIISLQSEQLISTINKFFFSPNLQKKEHKAWRLSENDFKKSIFLQVDGLFNPKLSKQHFSITTPI